MPPLAPPGMPGIAAPEHENYLQKKEDPKPAEEDAPREHLTEDRPPAAAEAGATTQDGGGLTVNRNVPGPPTPTSRSAKPGT